MDKSLNDCVCKPGFLLIDGECERLKICKPGEFNDGLNNCLACGQDCTRCTMYDGQCFECEDTFILWDASSLDAYCACNYTLTESREQP